MVVSADGRRDREAHGQEREPGPERAQALGVLEVEGQEEHHAEDPGAGDPDREERAAAGAVGDHAQRQQRVRDPPLQGDERGQQHGAGDQASDGAGIAPAVRLAPGQPVHEREQAGRGGQRPGEVEPRPVGSRDLVEQAAARDRRRDGEHDRHVQAPAPVEQLGQRAAEQQADRAAHAGDGGVDPERLAALGGVGERRRQQRQRGGREHRGERALHRSGADEHVVALRGAADGGGAGEAQQPRDERPLAAEEVGDAPAEQQQAAEAQRIGGDHPLALVVGEAELALGGRERDVHDRHVEDDEQLGDADHHEDQPAAIVVGGGCGGHGVSFGHMGRCGSSLL